MEGKGHVASTGRVELHRGFWCGIVRERSHLEDLGMGGKIILRWIIRELLGIV
jgi:hypothetical protein